MDIKKFISEKKKILLVAVGVLAVVATASAVLLSNGGLYKGAGGLVLPGGNQISLNSVGISNVSVNPTTFDAAKDGNHPIIKLNYSFKSDAAKSNLVKISLARNGELPKELYQKVSQDGDNLYTWDTLYSDSLDGKYTFFLEYSYQKTGLNGPEPVKQKITSPTFEIKKTVSAINPVGLGKLAEPVPSSQDPNQNPIPLPGQGDPLSNVSVKYDSTKGVLFTFTPSQNFDAIDVNLEDNGKALISDGTITGPFAKGTKYENKLIFNKDLVSSPGTYYVSYKADMGQGNVFTSQHYPFVVSAINPVGLGELVDPVPSAQDPNQNPLPLPGKENPPSSTSYISHLTATPSTIYPANGQSVTFTVALTNPPAAGATVTFNVVDDSNQPVTSFTLTGQKGSTVTKTWNGKVNGIKVDDGQYAVKATAGSPVLNNTNSAGANFQVASQLIPVDPKPGCAGYYDIPLNSAQCLQYEAALKYNQQLGTMTGYPDGTFGPYNTIKRSEILKVLYRADLKNENHCYSTPAFPDTPLTEWFAQLVCKAKKDSVVTGYTDINRFLPLNNVNRAEFAVLLTRMYHLKTPLDASVNYVGVPTDAFYSRAAAFFYKYGLWSGSNFEAGAAVTRIQVADIIYKIHLYGLI